MSAVQEAHERLARIPSLQVSRNEPLARHARFSLGGPALLFADTSDEAAFVEAVREASTGLLPWVVIGAGTNLIVSDSGYRGIVLRYRGAGITHRGTVITAGAGAVLQDVVDYAIAHGLKGLETMTGIPGCIGGAVYGNAGAYGRSMSDMVTRVNYFDGSRLNSADFEGCQFRYRSSVFKRNKRWLILSCDLQLEAGDSAELKKTAGGIREIRDRKYPPDMLCAGSIFKNCILAELPRQARDAAPESTVKGGKVPSAWFLEQVGAKGMSNGGVRVTDYHANTLYNAGGGTAAQFRELVEELKRRVREQFGFELEEEVQYVGFEEQLPGLDHIRATPHVIQGLLTGLEGAELRWKPSPERWSIEQVLAHLAEAERDCYLYRLQRILAERDPEVQAIGPSDPQPSPGRFALATLEEFLALRRESVDLLEGLPVEAMERGAIHSAVGRIKLAHMLNEWAFHDIGHIRQIAELVRAVRYYPHLGPYQPAYNVNP